MNGLTFRTLSRDDGPRLLALNEACPIVSGVTFVVDRAPDFFAWPSRVFDDLRYYGFMRGDRLVSCLLAGSRRVWNGRSNGPVVYIGDARVLPTERGQGLTSHGVKRIADTVDDRVELAYFLVRRGNAGAEGMERGIAPVPGVTRERLGGLDVASLWLPWAARASGAIRRAEPRDAGELAALLGTELDGRLFAPVVSEESLFTELSAERPRLEYFVFERHGRIAGVLGVDGACDGRRTKLLSVPGYVRSLRAIARGLGVDRFFPIVGRPTRAASVALVAARGGDSAVVRALLRHAGHELRARGTDVLRVGFDERDPQRAALRLLPATRARADVHIAVRAGRGRHRFSDLRRPPIFDMSIL